MDKTGKVRVEIERVNSVRVERGSLRCLVKVSSMRSGPWGVYRIINHQFPRTDKY